MLGKIKKQKSEGKEAKSHSAGKARVRQAPDARLAQPQSRTSAAVADTLSRSHLRVPAAEFGVILICVALGVTALS